MHHDDDLGSSFIHFCCCCCWWLFYSWCYVMMVKFQCVCVCICLGRIEFSSVWWINPVIISSVEEMWKKIFFFLNFKKKLTMMIIIMMRFNSICHCCLDKKKFKILIFFNLILCWFKVLLYILLSLRFKIIKLIYKWKSEQKTFLNDQIIDLTNGQ